MSDQKKGSIFSKILEAGEAVLDAQIAKAQNLVKAQAEADFNFGKAITKDRHQYVGSQGFYERSGTISFEHHKQIVRKSSIVSSILKTRQNKVAAFSDRAKDGKSKGFKVVLKDEEAALEKLREEMMGGEKADRQSAEARSSEQASDMRKADGNPVDPKDLELAAEHDANKDGELSEREIERALRKELKERTQKKANEIANFLVSCGELKDRPFESKKWSFDAFLRAIVWDSLAYDQIAVELIPKEASVVKNKINIHHFQPVDASTVRFASPELKKYNDRQMLSGYDILYPEEEFEALEEKDAFELDNEKLDNNEYKYVQVVNGKIERAFTENELSFGMRNPVTDLYANGYAISEIELLIGLITSHMQTEFYNKAYFAQGFSAKGILHVKANLNRSKLEELRRHWQHMVKGNRNSFQTPIMSGMQEIQWIPLTQNHSEMEFNLWLNYLIKMICSIYQIDPAEIGYGMKDEGKGGISGDNTEEKLKNSSDRGLMPLMRFLADFVNKNIIDNIDPDYKLEWVGLSEETPEAILKRQSEEVKFKKSVNEVREECGLPPIPGADELILDPTYFQWFTQFHPDGKKLEQERQQQEQSQFGGGEDQYQQMGGEGEENGEENYHVEEAQKEAEHERQQEAADAAHEREKEMYEHQKQIDEKYSDDEESEDTKKSLKIEYYRID